MPENESKLRHLEKNVELTEFLIPVRCTGIRNVRVMAGTYAQAIREAEEQVRGLQRYSSEEIGKLQDFKAEALALTLMLAPEQRAAWPYWGYGWYGTDGVDWRSYRTDKGPGSIPDIAEESWPIPPFEDR